MEGSGILFRLPACLSFCVLSVSFLMLSAAFVQCSLYRLKSWSAVSLSGVGVSAMVFIFCSSAGCDALALDRTSSLTCGSCSMSKG